MGFLHTTWLVTPQILLIQQLKAQSMAFEASECGLKTCHNATLYSILGVSVACAASAPLQTQKKPTQNQPKKNPKQTQPTEAEICHVQDDITQLWNRLQC